jgi:8-oxo-dGTP diphosphatase
MSEATVSPITLFPATNAAIVNSEGKVLLTLRSEKVREPHLWCLPGGHLDPGESWYDGCVREVQEEVGVAVSGGQLLGIYSDPALNVVPHTKAPGGLGQFVVALFLFDAPEQAIHPNEEVAEWGWFDPKHPPDKLIPSHAIRLKDLIGFTGAAFFR